MYFYCYRLEVGKCRSTPNSRTSVAYLSACERRAGSASDVPVQSSSMWIRDVLFTVGAPVLSHSHLWRSLRVFGCDVMLFRWIHFWNVCSLSFMLVERNIHAKNICCLEWHSPVQGLYKRNDTFCRSGLSKSNPRMLSILKIDLASTRSWWTTGIAILLPSPQKG